MRQPLNVNVGNRQLCVKGEALALGQQRAVFIDQGVARVDHIGGGFAGSGSGVDIRRHAARRLLAHQVAAIRGLAQQFRAGRGIHDQRGPGQCGAPAGRLNGPQVLANLNAHNAVGQVVGAEEKVCTKGDVACAHAHAAANTPGTRGKPALLIKLVGGGEKALGHNPQQPLWRNEGRAVVDAPAVGHGQPHHSANVARGTRGFNFFEGSRRAIKQQRLVEEVGGAVAGECQLGEGGDGYALRCKLRERLDNGACVEGEVGHAQCGRDGGCADIAQRGGGGAHRRVRHGKISQVAVNRTEMIARAEPFTNPGAEWALGG